MVFIVIAVLALWIGGIVHILGLTYPKASDNIWLTIAAWVIFIWFIAIIAGFFINWLRKQK